MELGPSHNPLVCVVARWKDVRQVSIPWKEKNEKKNAQGGVLIKVFWRNSCLIVL